MQQERAQQLKEERKANIMRVAQNDIVGGTSTGGFSNGNHSYVRWVKLILIECCQ
jgi:hypothetical protein